MTKFGPFLEFIENFFVGMELFLASVRLLPRAASVNAEVRKNVLPVGYFGESQEETLYALTDREKREREEEISPYWREQGRGMRSFGYGHNVHTLEKVLKKGFLGIKEEAEERLARIDRAEPEELRKVPFLEGVVMAMEAAAEIGKRYASRARELAEKEESGERKTELLKIAEVCDWVPANPARTFYEALPSYYFACMMLNWETWGAQGRMDQYLYPYYERDIREGRITKEEAQELIDCFIIKSCVSRGMAGGVQIAVGGLKADGNDATNDMSYIFI